MIQQICHFWYCSIPAFWSFYCLAKLRCLFPVKVVSIHSESVLAKLHTYCWAEIAASKLQHLLRGWRGNAINAYRILEHSSAGFSINRFVQEGLPPMIASSAFRCAMVFSKPYKVVASCFEAFSCRTKVEGLCQLWHTLVMKYVGLMWSLFLT